MSELRFEPSGPGIEKAHSDIKVAGSLVPFTIERPDRRRFGDEISDNVVLYLTGWTESEDSIKPLRSATARFGTAAATLYHPRYKRPDKVLRAPRLRVENVAAVTEILQNDFETVSIGAHSMAGIDSTQAALDYELDINVLALLGSAALIIGDRFNQVAPRVFEEIIHEEASNMFHHPFSEGRFAYQSLATIIQNPALATIEGIAAATHYVGRHIPTLVDRGTVVANIMADGDRIFPVQEVLKSTEDLPFDVVKVFSESCHNFTYHRPGEVGAFVIDIIEHADEMRGLRTQQKTQSRSKQKVNLRLASA